MYLSKNPRCILRTNAWLSSNIFERNFKTSFRNSRARWPEDDPIKPPLRLNIPKDAVHTSPFQFTSQINLDGPKLNVNMGKLSSCSPFESNRDVRCQSNKISGGDEATGSEDVKKPPVNEISGNSSDMLNQNYVLKSKSSECSDNSRNSDENRTIRREKNFKLEKIITHGNLKIKPQDDGLSKESENEHKNGILTIKIALNDSEDYGDSVIKGLSEVEAPNGFTDQQIRVLAEAIADELKPKGQNVPAKACAKSPDEAYLVIINVMERDTVRKPSAKITMPPNTENESLEKTNFKASAEAEDEDTSIQFGYGTEIQVRNLEPRNDLEKYLFKKTVERPKKRRESRGEKETEIQNLLDVTSLPSSRSLESVIGIVKNSDIEFVRPFTDLRSMRHKPWIPERRSYPKKEAKLRNSSEELTKEKERRRELFEKHIQEARTSRNLTPVGRKMKAKEQNNKLVNRKFSLKNPTKGIIESQCMRPIICSPEREMRMQGEHYFGNETEALVERDKKEDSLPTFLLKPLSKQITFIDELPELLRYPEYKYSILTKSQVESKPLESMKHQIKSNNVRSYHKSCRCCSKLTDNTGEGESPLIIMTNLGKHDAKNTKTNRNDFPEGPQQKNFKKLDKEYPNLDNSSDVFKQSQLIDLKGPNDVFLQEGNVICKKDQSMEVKIGKNTHSGKENSQIEEATRVKVNDKEETDINNERYEPDFVDTRLFLKNADPGLIVKVPCGECYPTVRTMTKAYWGANLNEISCENFEMNVKCLEKANDPQALEKGNTSVCDSSPNNKNEAVIKNELRNTPKLSDNIVNLANEDLAESKGSTFVDSLSMMKKVKEIVDLDLKNAEKIFVPAKEEQSVRKNQVEFSEKNRNSEPQTKELDLFTPKSVVLFNEPINKFYVLGSELERAMNARKKELTQYENIKSAVNPGIIHENRNADFKGDVDKCLDAPPDALKSYVLKKGDSVIIYDEETRKWKVDFTMLREKNMKRDNHKEKNRGTNSGKSDAPKDKPERETRSKKVTDMPQATKQQSEPLLQVNTNTVVTSPVNAEKKGKQPDVKRRNDLFKEVDAQEIRRKNSDLYDDVITGMKKTNPEERGKSPECRQKAEGTERLPSDHYVSNNIVEMSKNNTIRARPNKIETVKLNVTATTRPPSKVTEINLNKKTEDSEQGRDSENADDKKPNFYKKFEKYKTPFSDPEYEEKPMKINSDLKSNPNLKKLDTWNKTLVLQKVSKSQENLESWIKDETDKMATLLLKVLHDAAEGNSRKRIPGKASGKGNPYEAIRKKQESPVMSRARRKESGRRWSVPIQVKTTKGNAREEANQKTAEERGRRGKFPLIEDESQVEVMIPDSLLPKEYLGRTRAPLAVLNENSIDDIPGPDFLKKLSALWRYLPEIGCQTTIFMIIQMFQVAKTGLSLISSDDGKHRSDPFGKFFLKYGPVVKLQGPLTGDIVLISRPEDMSNVFSQEIASPARSVFDSLENCRVRVGQKKFPLGITDLCNGIDWDIVRKSTIDASREGCLQYFSILKHVDDLFMDKIQSTRNHQNQVPEDFIVDVKRWSMEGLCCVLFDKSLGFFDKKQSHVQWISESERLMRHLSEATDYLCQCESSFQLWRFINTPALSGLNQAYQGLDLIVSKYVYQAEILLRKKKKAIISNKNNAKNVNLTLLESMLLNDRMTAEEITANVIDMLIMGPNTTTIALAFLLYNLAQNSRAQRQLFKEIKELLPSKNSPLNYHQLHSLKYLQACLKESMRLNIPIPILLKVLANDTALANYRVPNGTHMVMDAITACMKEQTFDEPERFKPERWLEQECIHPFSTIPFCNGPRGDFIKRLAEIQLWTCIAKIVRNYQIEYHFGDLRSTGRFMSYPDKPLKLTFIERDE